MSLSPVVGLTAEILQSELKKKKLFVLKQQSHFLLCKECNTSDVRDGFIQSLIKLKVKLATVVEGNRKVPFSKAITPVV